MNATGINYFSQITYDHAMSTVGDPVFLSLLVLLVFFGYLHFAGTSFEVKMVILPFAVILAAAVGTNWLLILFGLACGIIIALAILKLTNH